MNQNEIIKIVKKELDRPTVEFVEQFLEIHEIEKNGDEPVIVRIEARKREKTALVYLVVKNELFYFLIWIDLKSKKAVWANTEIYSKLTLVAYSRSLSIENLQKLTKIPATKTRKKGEMLNSKLKRKENQLIFESQIIPDDFESHLAKFIKFLEKDAKGIKKLSTKADLQLHLVLNFHNGNGMLGGFSFSPSILNRLVTMGIKIDWSGPSLVES